MILTDMTFDTITNVVSLCSLLYLFQFSSIDLCTATTKPKFTQYSTTQLQMTVSLLILDQFRQSWAHFKEALQTTAFKYNIFYNTKIYTIQYHPTWNTQQSSTTRKFKWELIGLFPAHVLNFDFLILFHMR